jgi:hypothetical protein
LSRLVVAVAAPLTADSETAEAAAQVVAVEAAQSPVAARAVREPPGRDMPVELLTTARPSLTGAVAVAVALAGLAATVRLGCVVLVAQASSAWMASNAVKVA